MALIGLKPPVLMAPILMLVCIYAQSASAAEPLGLKMSGKLGYRAAASNYAIDQEKPKTSLLGKINFFKGVEVDDTVAQEANQIPTKTTLSVSEEKPASSIKAIYGGVQLSLQENLSVVYTPGRLSKATMNGEGEGLYLLTNRGGLANWFVGIESITDSTPSNPRRDTNTAQIGVMFKLD